jgi:hypothetical protein
LNKYFVFVLINIYISNEFKNELTDENSVGCFSAKRLANNLIVNKVV